MKQIPNLKRAEKNVFKKVIKHISIIRKSVSDEPSNLMAGIEILENLRKEIYEDLNQIQHEAMILKAARLIETSDFSNQKIEWFWNPRQTGGTEEPDLRGVINGEIVISAEITTSVDPQGTIDTRMRDTLKKLSKLPGKKIYYVRSKKMKQRAETKVNKTDYSIDIRLV